MSENSIVAKLAVAKKEKSKHHEYQSLPNREFFKSREASQVLKFYEKERLGYIYSKLNINNKKILEVGCNTGYVFFDFLDNGAASVRAYEGKQSCIDFMKYYIPNSGDQDRVEFYPEYFSFSKQEEKFDITVLLNVLHHLGDDYGDHELSKDNAKKSMLGQLNSISSYSEYVVFQMGFNWKGDRNDCLFDNGLKSEMIRYITEGTKSFWEVEVIGVAEENNNSIVYRDLNDTNIHRNDALGEFLNRPIFIMKSVR